MYCSYSIDSGEIKTTIKHKKTNVILILMTERTKYTYICLGDDNDAMIKTSMNLCTSF